MKNKIFPGKLYHEVPGWVEPGSVFHIRMKIHSGSRPFINNSIAENVIDSVIFYNEKMKWHSHLFLLMPDHVHALLSFPRGKGMSSTIRDWKRFHTKHNKIKWQGNYFDHRIRNEDEFVEKASYIRMNPVRAGLCEKVDDWPWCLDCSDGLNS